MSKFGRDATERGGNDLDARRGGPPRYAELGEICNGSKPGREGKELIVCDLTGTGAQDAAIGQVAWEKLGLGI